MPVLLLMYPVMQTGLIEFFRAAPHFLQNVTGRRGPDKGAGAFNIELYSRVLDRVAGRYL